MTWGNPPPFIPDPPKKGKKVTPEDLAGASEGSQQKALMVWASLQSAKYPQLKWLVHIPNGGTRNIREAVELKAQGVKAGVPDLMLAYPVRQHWDQLNSDGSYHGLFLEMKVKPNKVSPEQIAWIENLIINGYYCKVCYSWIEARDTLIAYLEGKL
jgi:hypothetical protein